MTTAPEPTPHERRRRGLPVSEAGFAPLTMMLGLGLLVIPILLLVLTVPTWEARTLDARDAASDAARTLAGADSWVAGVNAANQTINQETANDGLNPADITVRYSGTLSPGATVTAAVTVTIPAGAVPGVGAFGTLHYTTSSTQHIDNYRSLPQ